MRNFVIVVLGVIVIGLLIGSGAEVISSVFASTPWWVYFVLAGIVYSGYRATVHMAEEKKVDDAFIEEEGRKYIERMKEERERRNITRKN